MKQGKFGYLEYIHNESRVKEFEMMKKFKSYNIIRERVELYKDFTINLLHYIHHTYLGKEYIKTEKEILEHFTWCYGKVLNEFYDEEISFYENGELFEYFYTYYVDQFYKKETVENISHHEKFWENIFEIRNSKNRKVFEVLLELYEIFDNSLNTNDKKIPELEII